MSLHEYHVSREIARSDPPFYALIMAAMRKADTVNGARLADAFPEIAGEFFARYHAPLGVLPDDHHPQNSPATGGGDVHDPSTNTNEMEN